MTRRSFAKFARGAIVVLAVAAIPLGIFVYHRIRPALIENNLIAACQSGDAKRAEQLLNEGVDPNKLSAGFSWDVANALAGHPLHDDDLNRYPPLTFAVMDGKTEIVKILIAHGADPNASNVPYDGLSPLMRAVMAGNVGIVRVLIAHGANVNAKYKDNLTILDACRRADVCTRLTVAGAKSADYFYARGDNDR